VKGDPKDLEESNNYAKKVPEEILSEFK